MGGGGFGVLDWFVMINIKEGFVVRQRKEARKCVQEVLVDTGQGEPDGFFKEEQEIFSYIKSVGERSEGTLKGYLY